MTRKQQMQRTAERLDRVLQTPTPLSSDDDVTAMAVAAQALAPAVHPREAWRATLKDRMLREAAGTSSAGAGIGSLDGQGTAAVHTVEVTSPAFGRVVLADVEHISEQRAAQVAETITAVLGERIGS